MGILMLGAGLQGTLLGVRATLEGFPTLVIGAVMAAYYVGYVAGSLVAPSLIHRVGHIRVFAALSSVTSRGDSPAIGFSGAGGLGRATRGVRRVFRRYLRRRRELAQRPSEKR